MLRIHLLGEFRVEVEGVVLTETRWPRRDVKRLLQLLAVKHNHRLAKEQVAECLWPGLSGQTARNRLYNVLYVLRGQLEPERAPRGASRYVHTSGETIQLGPPEAVWIDADEFEHCLDAASVDEESAQTLGRLEQALTLYRGTLLDDAQDESWACTDRAHLEQRYRGALRTQARLLQSAGRPDAAVSALQRLVRTDLTDEAAQRSLIQALAGAGRRTEALAQYRLCKEVLRSQLGLAPSAETAALVQQIKAEPTASPVFEAVHARRPDEAAPPQPRGPKPIMPTQALPEMLTTVLGRERELLALRGLLESTRPRLLTLTGVGGVGKTVLATRLASELRERFEHGAAFVALATLSDPALLGMTIAHALGLAQRDGTSPIEHLRQHLAERQMLIVLDNFEHLTASVAIVTDLLSWAPRLLVLVTSRTPLRVREERLFTVPPLALAEPADLSSMARLAQVPAVALFVQRAAAIDASFALTHANAEAVSAICARLDGLPLAIELAAARTRLFNPQALLERLDQRFALLNRGAADSPERHRSLCAVLDWSYRLLAPEAQQLFASLSVCSGGCTLDTVHDLFGAMDEQLDDLIATLVDHSLLTVVPQHAESGSAPRLVTLETVQAYARERLIESAESNAVRQAHALHFVEWAVGIAGRLRGPNQRSELDRLEAEHNNLRVALDWAMVHDVSLAYRAVAALSYFWFVRGYLQEGRRCNDAVLALEGDADPALRAKCLQAAARLCWCVGDMASARRRLEECLSLRRTAGEPRGVAKALIAFGALLIVQSEPTTAAGLLREALALGRQNDDASIIGRALVDLTLALTLSGDYAGASAAADECFGIGRTHGSVNERSHVLVTAAFLYLITGERERALKCGDEAFMLARDAGYQAQAAIALVGIGECLHCMAEYEASAQRLQEALVIARRSGHRYAEAVALLRLGKSALRLGDLVQAQTFLGRSRVLFEAMGAVTFFDECLCACVEVCVEQQDTNGSLLHLRSLLGMRSRYAAHHIASVLEVAAALTLLQDDAAFAVELLGAARAERQRLGVPLPRSDRQRQSQLLRRARTQVHRHPWRALWARGECSGAQVLLDELAHRYGAAHLKCKPPAALISA
jgi:predicted ATPase/DNA-binding SARP family transcriptional activator